MRVLTFQINISLIMIKHDCVLVHPSQKIDHITIQIGDTLGHKTSVGSDMNPVVLKQFV